LLPTSVILLTISARVGGGSLTSRGGVMAAPCAVGWRDGRHARRWLCGSWSCHTIIIGPDTFTIQGEPKRDRERLIWTLELVPAW